MILVDAGPLISILDRDDEDHTACVDASAGLTRPMLTTWPAFTEAMYLLGDRAGWSAQELLWRLVQRGDLLLHDLDETLRRRSRDLMKTYEDVPMDLADATLVSVAEQLDLVRVFTLDSDFRIYRIKGRKAFDIVP